jgi:uncharacterized protein YyaL (SSP411 family)
MENMQPNKLIHETSPYLLQHAYNPVDWYPWGEEAFQLAKELDKPVFLSVGYSSCHWCHVMAHETFEDEDAAKVLNENFVCVKVDREERPDIDELYMETAMAMGQASGWPLHVFMTPDGLPFYTGTYFPKEDQYGVMGLITVAQRITDLWQNHRDELLQTGRRVKKIFEAPPRTGGKVDPAAPFKAVEQLKSIFDARYGGLAGEFKFPQAHLWQLALHAGTLTCDADAVWMVKSTLGCMAAGGIQDQIGYGFSRYSTDEKWLVPHFEKMLYDNAQLAYLYAQLSAATKETAYGRIAGSILTWVVREMRDPEGGFYTALDADSEGEEGLYYLWTPAQVKAVLGDVDGTIFCRLMDITEEGNFQGRNIPNLIGRKLTPKDEAFLEKNLSKLLQDRFLRVPPAKDDKILVGWNGLMIAALAEAYRTLGKEKYLDMARECVQFLQLRMVRPDGRLYNSWRQGAGKTLAVQSDYAFLIYGLLHLYQTDLHSAHLKWALHLAENMMELFEDKEHGGLYQAASDSQLFARTKDSRDGALPSGNAMAAWVFHRLYRLTGDNRWEDRCERLFDVFAREINADPLNHAWWLDTLLTKTHEEAEVVLIPGEGMEALHEVALEGYDPGRVIIKNSHHLQGVVSYLDIYPSTSEKAAAYVCKNQVCSQPVYTSSDLRRLLHGAL